MGTSYTPDSIPARSTLRRVGALPKDLASGIGFLVLGAVLILSFIAFVLGVICIVIGVVIAARRVTVLSLSIRRSRRGASLAR